MCGIVGYIGHQKATPILLAGLSKLEYRGYDSAGIATMEQNEIKIVKDKGYVENIYNLDETKKLEGNIGIAHTRWATHGIPSKINSHPHSDNSGSFAVVHNGIIENYTELKAFLEERGYHFVSDTDTEVVPNLIHYYYKKNETNSFSNVSENYQTTLDTTSIEPQKVLKAVQQACKKLIGSFALEILSTYCPDNLIVVRKDSPLVLGKGHGENYVASDVPAILSYTKDFYFLSNLEFVLLSRDDIKFFDEDLNPIQKETTTITWDAMSADKLGYSDFMLKEIMEQPTAIRETIGSRLSYDKCSFDELNFSKEYLSSLNKIYIVACGTAMHAGLVAKNIIEHLCKISTEVDIASEFRYRDPLVDDKTLCIFISQSGETADTLAALRLSKEHRAKTIAITNVLGSSISREADFSLYTHAGPEIAVASTKAYTSQITLLTLLSIYFAEILESYDLNILKDLKKDLLDIPTKVEEILKNADNLKPISESIFKEKDIFYLGRGIDYALCMEGSLKLKEISYIHSESYAAGELKHGTIALIEKDINVIGIITDKNMLKKTLSNIEEVLTRGANCTIVIAESLVSQINKSLFKNIIVVPDTNYFIFPILTIIPLQLLAYFVSKEKGLDVDKPRNLAKSVTVE